MIEEFTIAATDEQLADLKQRLANTRWPEAEVVDDWNQGIPLAYVQDVCDYWANGYDWRAREALLNRFDHFRTEISQQLPSERAGHHGRNLDDAKSGTRAALGLPAAIVAFVHHWSPFIRREGVRLLSAKAR